MPRWRGRGLEKSVCDPVAVPSFSNAIQHFIHPCPLIMHFKSVFFFLETFQCVPISHFVCILEMVQNSVYVKCSSNNTTSFVFGFIHEHIKIINKNN